MTKRHSYIIIGTLTTTPQTVEMITCPSIITIGTNILHRAIIKIATTITTIKMTTLHIRIMTTKSNNSLREMLPRREPSSPNHHTMMSSIINNSRLSIKLNKIQGQRHRLVHHWESSNSTINKHQATIITHRIKHKTNLSNKQIFKPNKISFSMTHQLLFNALLDVVESSILTVSLSIRPFVIRSSRRKENNSMLNSKEFLMVNIKK